MIYQTYSGTKVTLEGVDYLVIQAKNILAIITLRREMHMSKDIHSGKDAKTSLLEGVDLLAQCAPRSPSDPRRNVVLDKGDYGSPLITNDGVTIAKEIELKDPYQNMGAGNFLVCRSRFQRPMMSPVTGDCHLACPIHHPRGKPVDSGESGARQRRHRTGRS